MAIIRKSDLKNMSADALKQKLGELEAELTRERGMIKGTGKPSNAGKYKEMRRLKARIKTLLGKLGIKA